jgi:hypothetical protein
MWLRVDLVWADVSEECIVSETSVHTRSTRLHIPEDGILQSPQWKPQILLKGNDYLGDLRINGKIILKCTRLHGVITQRITVSTIMNIYKVINFHSSYIETFETFWPKNVVVEPSRILDVCSVRFSLKLSKMFHSLFLSLIICFCPLALCIVFVCACVILFSVFSVIVKS